MKILIQHGRVIDPATGLELAQVADLTAADTQRAIDAAERLRETIANARIPLTEGLPVTFSVSIGVSSMGSAEDNIDVLLNLADKALYEAKGGGRNRVCGAG